MAAGDAFTLVPKGVTTEEPQYHNIITPSESMKKDFMNISSTPVERWKLKFDLSNTDRDILKAHCNDQYGGYHSFSWQSVPAYIGGGSNITGRWIGGSLTMTPMSGMRWDCTIIFEKDN